MHNMYMRELCANCFWSTIGATIIGKVNILSFASDFSLSGSNRELVKGQFHCSDLFVV